MTDKGLLELKFQQLFYFDYKKADMDIEELTEKDRLIKEKEYYQARYEEIEERWDRVRKILHNIQNHYILEIEYLKTGQYQLLMEHYQKILGELQTREKIVYTGNMGIDSVLRYKADLAKQEGILVGTEVCMKSDITLDFGDMNVILGNLLDNAVEAVKNSLHVERRIDVVIKSDATSLFFQISNGYEGKRVKNHRGEYLTGKADKNNHGLGLAIVKKLVKKYRGSMEIVDENNRFSVRIFLYM